MTTTVDDAGYHALPALSPYIRHDRFETPKEVFKFVAAKLAAIAAVDRECHMADIGCANGEMLYFLRKQFPLWRFEGFDLTPAFVEAGRAYPPMAGITLHVRDLYEVEGSFDVVSFINVLTTMDDPDRPLEKLLSLTRPGGLLLVEGIFNCDDIEFRAMFMDNSRPESRGIWRREYSQHSRRRIAGFLAGKCRKVEFDDVPMNVSIPRVPDAPAINVWTFRDEQGRNIVTNATHMMLDKTLMTVHR